MKQMKRFLSLLLALCFVLGIIPSTAFAAGGNLPFTDVDTTDWYYDAVQYAYEKGMMNGTSTTAFSPNDTTTRGMIVTILHRMEGTPAATGTAFTDVPVGQWYSDAVSWASANGIVGGYGGGLFGPGDPITREQMAAILNRYSTYKGYDAGTVGSIVGFSDASQVSAYAAEPMGWAIGNGLISGVGNNTLAPKGNATRAQVATILIRFCKNIADKANSTPGTPVNKTYTVTFDLNYGSNTQYDAKTVKEGETVSKPSNPSRSGYSFGGWYAQKSSGRQFDFKTGITSDLTLYAHWSSNSSSGGGGGYVPPSTTYYTVTFYMNDRTDAVHTTSSVAYGGVVAAPVQPARTEYSFGGWYTDMATTSAYNFSNAVTGNLSLYAKWNITEEEPRPDGTVGVSFSLLIDKVITNSGEFRTQWITRGSQPRKPVDPVATVGTFAGWYDSPECNATFDFDKPVTENTIVYAKWDIDKTDSDGDGLYDALEAYIGTDPQRADTDSDGLSDYIELTIGTNPLIVDSDSNGVSDFDEDADVDGLSNGREVEIGTNPTSIDTDMDSLNDEDEVNRGTNPTLKDSDGDGADDGWEVRNGFDPLSFNASFTVTSSSAPVSPENPVAAQVDVTLNGDQACTLGMQSINYSDDPMLSAAIPGYLGSAYDFTVDGTFGSATLTFTYDSSLGIVGEDFQPRIYLFDEETRQLDELPDQTVSGNTVTATVPHFSTYVLLNSAEFDAAWDEEIKPPLGDGEDETSVLDIMFVIDYSASMDDNDPNQTFKPLSKAFISKLRDGKDRAGIVKFIARETLVSNLTADKELLNGAIDSISYDSGHGSNSGTNGSAGIHMALEQLTMSASEYKYIVFITDGEDNRDSYSYDMLIETAMNSGVTIYTIGMGNASELILRKLAGQTGGKYYHATTGASVDDFIDLDDVFADIEEETVDLTTDSNGDGISDYYARLIYEGRLKLSNGSAEFAGINFDSSPDIDGDGLLNGEELFIVQDPRTNRVYMSMISDPTLRHSDGDGIDDKTELDNGTDPLKSEGYRKSAVDYLMDDDNFSYEYYVDNVYDDSLLYQIDSAFLATITGVWNTQELYRDILINYFSSHVDQIDGATQKYLRAMIVENADRLLGIIESGRDIQGNIGTIKGIKDLINAANGYETSLDALMISYKKIVETVKIYDSDANVFIVSTYKMREINVNAVVTHSPLKSFDTSGLKLDIALDAVDGAVDIGDTVMSFAKVQANNQVFEQNLDFLREMSDYGSRPNLRNAANDVLNALAEGYGEAMWSAIGGDVAEMSVNMVISIASCNPYVAAVVTARDLIDMITGLSDTLEREYKMLAYESMATSANSLVSDSMYAFNGIYFDSTGNATRYLTHLAQIRVLGEEMWKDFYTNGMNSWFQDDQEIIDSFNYVVGSVRSVADTLDLPMSPNLPGSGGGGW